MIAEHPSVAEALVLSDPAATPQAVPARRRFTTAEYHAMAEAGVLAEDERVELITGEIVRMGPIGSRHIGCVIFLQEELSVGLRRRANLSVQNSVQVADGQEPQPDLAILRFREDRYRGLLPAPADVLLIIEVADSSADYDRNIKLPLYAQAGIPEAWLVRLRDACIEIHRGPAATGYQEMRTFRSGDRVSSLAFPDLELAVAAILGDA
jgi:Uma2 family endonuclease